MSLEIHRGHTELYIMVLVGGVRGSSRGDCWVTTLGHSPALEALCFCKRPEERQKVDWRSISARTFAMPHSMLFRVQYCLQTFGVKDL